MVFFSAEFSVSLSTNCNGDVFATLHHIALSHLDSAYKPKKLSSGEGELLMTQETDEISIFRKFFYWVMNKITKYPSDTAIENILMQIRSEALPNEKKGPDNNFSETLAPTGGCCILKLPEGSGRNEWRIDVQNEAECKKLKDAARKKYPGIYYRKPFLNRKCSEN